VVVADINLAGATETAKRLRSAEAAEVDVTDAAAVQALVDRVADARGLDFMFNNAGIAIIGDASDLSISDWDRLVDVNIRGVIYGTHAAYARMRARGRGHIVNTASIAGLIPAPAFTGYAATKHAVVGLSTSLRAEGAAVGVKVSAICPGVIETPMVDGAERRGFATGLGRDALGGTPYPVERCAKDALDGVARNDALIVVTTSAKVIHTLYRHSPAAGHRLVAAGFARARKKSGGSR
jgi:NAD(P)-dependent dehydrogenase (short-subunit alcohol dehydrogenase family)